MIYAVPQSTVDRDTRTHTHHTHTAAESCIADLLLVRTCSCGNSAAAKHELQMHAKPRVPVSVVQLTSDSGTKRVVAISHPFDAYFVSLFVVITTIDEPAVGGLELCGVKDGPGGGGSGATPVVTQGRTTGKRALETRRLGCCRLLRLIAAVVQEVGMLHPTRAPSRGAAPGASRSVDGGQVQATSVR